MDIKISSHGPHFTPEQLHGLITADRNEATTLTGWEAIKYFLVQLLNHLPGISFDDKKEFLEKEFKDLNGNLENGYHETHPAMYFISKLFALIAKTDKDTLSANILDNIKLTVKWADGHEGNNHIAFTHNGNKQQSLRMFISINDVTLPPVNIENSHDSLMPLHLIKNIIMKPTHAHHNEFTFDLDEIKRIQHVTTCEKEPIATDVRYLLAPTDDNETAEERLHPPIIIHTQRNKQHYLDKKHSQDEKYYQDCLTAANISREIRSETLAIALSKENMTEEDENKFNSKVAIHLLNLSRLKRAATSQGKPIPVTEYDDFYITNSNTMRYEENI